MRKMINVFLVAIVGIFVVGGTLTDYSLGCSGDKHDGGEKKQSGGQ